MSVDIFGGSYVTTRRPTARKTYDDVTEKPHESDPMIQVLLSQVEGQMAEVEKHNLILQSKLSQFGDQTLFGDLLISLRGVHHRSFGVNDIIEEDDTVSLLLGNNANKIDHSFNFPIEILSDAGVKGVEMFVHWVTS